MKLCKKAQQNISYNIKKLKIFFESIVLAFVILFFTGCCSKQEPIIPEPVQIIKIEYIKQDIPNELLECNKLPDVPFVNKQSQLMNYVTELWNVADDCKNKLREIKKLDK